MTGVKSFYISCILIALAAEVPCAPNAFSGRTACLFPIVDFSDPPDQSDRRETITGMVGLELKSAGFTLIPEEEWRAKAAEASATPLDLVSGPAAAALAKSLGADMAVSGYYILGDGFITVCVQCIETATGSIVSGILKKDRFNLGFYNSLNAEIAGMLAAVGTGLDAPASIASSVPALLTEMTFASPQEGLEVIIGGDVIAGFIEGGRLIFETAAVSAGTPFVVEKRLEGFHTERQTVNAAAEISLTPLVKASRFAVEANWTLGQLMGLGGAFRYYILPDLFFVSNSHYLYFQAPYTPGAAGLLHYDVGVQAGLYVFWGPGESFRLSIAAGFGTVFSFFFVPDLYPATDVYLNVVNVTAEWNMPGFSLYLRPEWKFTLGIGNNLLGLSSMHWEVFPPLTFGAVFKW